MMSRTYLLYGECENIDEDKLWLILDHWCGHSQVFKVDVEKNSVASEAFFYCEMGCSSGIAPEETIEEFKKLLEKNRGKKVSLKCWSMHPDEIICKTEASQ
jgi:hypothetical protein